jgi:hypothetical protein
LIINKHVVVSPILANKGIAHVRMKTRSASRAYHILVIGIIVYG